MTFSLEPVVLRLKRAETPFFRVARKVYDFSSSANLPVPQFFKPVGRLLYEGRSCVPVVWKRLECLIYIQPIFPADVNRWGDVYNWSPCRTSLGIRCFILVTMSGLVATSPSPQVGSGIVRHCALETEPSSDTM